MDWANQVAEGLETFFKDPNTYGTLGVNEENEIVYILQDNFKRPLQWKHKQERLSHIIKRGKIIVLREKSKVVFHIYTVDQNQVSTIFIGLLSMEGGGNFHCEVIVHELIHLTNEEGKIFAEQTKSEIWYLRPDGLISLEDLERESIALAITTEVSRREAEGVEAPKESKWLDKAEKMVVQGYEELEKLKKLANDYMDEELEKALRKKQEEVKNLDDWFYALNCIHAGEAPMLLVYSPFRFLLEESAVKEKLFLKGLFSDYCYENPWGIS